MLNLIGTIIPLDWLIGAVAGAVGLFAAFFAGKRSAKVDTLKGYKETRQRMDEADDQIMGDDPAVLRSRLRERGDQ